MSFSYLPSEVIQEIICRGLDSSKDIISLGCTSKRFNKIAKSNIVWKCLCEKQWPNLHFHFDALNNSNNAADAKPQEVTESKFECLLNCLKSGKVVIWQHLYNALQLILKYIKELEFLHYSNDEIDDEELYKFDHLCEHLGVEFLLSVFYYILESNDSRNNLTVKYYTRKVLRYFLTKHLSKLWLSYLDNEGSFVQESSFSHLMQGALLLERWICPYEQLDDLEIRQFIANSVEGVLKYLNKYNFGNPCLAWDFSESSCCTIALSNKEQSVILKAISFVFSQQYKFDKNEKEMPFFHVDNSCVHKVIKNRYGIPMSLCILFREVALQFGIALDVINYPGVVILRYKKQQEDINKNHVNFDKTFTYFVPSEGCIEKGFQELGGIPALYEETSTVDILTRISNNVIKAVKKQQVCNIPLYYIYDQHMLINKSDQRVLISRMIEMINRTVNLDKLLSNLSASQQIFMNFYDINPAMLQTIVDRKQELLNRRKMGCEISLPELMMAKHRSEHLEVMYSVGMIAHHRRYDYMCVIRGWDNTCTSSDQWIEQMRVNQLPSGQHQPFYNVLVSDGSERYAAQESLEVINNDVNFDQEVTHFMVGRYFSRYIPKAQGNVNQVPVLKSYYMPNKVVLQLYPEDLNTSQQLSTTGKL